MNEKLRELLMKYKRYWYAPVLVVMGIALMLIRPDRNQTVETAAIGISDRNFVSETEARLEEMLKGINGAGDCEVTITLASGGKK